MRAAGHCWPMLTVIFNTIAVLQRFSQSFNLTASSKRSIFNFHMIHLHGAVNCDNCSLCILMEGSASPLHTMDSISFGNLQLIQAWTRTPRLINWSLHLIWLFSVGNSMGVHPELSWYGHCSSVQKQYVGVCAKVGKHSVAPNSTSVKFHKPSNL